MPASFQPFNSLSLSLSHARMHAYTHTHRNLIFLSLSLRLSFFPSIKAHMLDAPQLSPSASLKWSRLLKRKKNKRLENHKWAFAGLRIWLANSLCFSYYIVCVGRMNPTCKNPKGLPNPNDLDEFLHWCYQRQQKTQLCQSKSASSARNHAHDYARAWTAADQLAGLLLCSSAVYIPPPEVLAFPTPLLTTNPLS